MPTCGIVRRSGRKTSSTAQSKLPVPRKPVTSQLPGNFGTTGTHCAIRIVSTISVLRLTPDSAYTCQSFRFHNVPDSTTLSSLCFVASRVSAEYLVTQDQD